MCKIQTSGVCSHLFVRYCMAESYNKKHMPRQHSAQSCTRITKMTLWIRWNYFSIELELRWKHRYWNKLLNNLGVTTVSLPLGVHGKWRVTSAVSMTHYLKSLTTDFGKTCSCRHCGKDSGRDNSLQTKGRQRIHVEQRQRVQGTITGHIAIYVIIESKTGKNRRIVSKNQQIINPTGIGITLQYS